MDLDELRTQAREGIDPPPPKARGIVRKTMFANLDWPDMPNLRGGIPKGRLLSVFSSTRYGKTSASKRFATAMAAMGHKVAYVSPISPSMLERVREPMGDMADAMTLAMKSLKRVAEEAKEFAGVDRAVRDDMTFAIPAALALTTASEPASTIDQYEICAQPFYRSRAPPRMFMG